MFVFIGIYYVETKLINWYRQTWMPMWFLGKRFIVQYNIHI